MFCNNFLWENNNLDIRTQQQVLLLGADIGRDGHPWLWTKIWLVGSDRFAVVTVDILLEEPVPGHVGQLHLDHGDLLAAGVGVGPVAVRAEQDVGRGCLSSTLRPFVPRLESEVLPLLQSVFYVIRMSDCLSNFFWFDCLDKTNKSDIIRLAVVQKVRSKKKNLSVAVTLPHVCRGEGEEDRQEGGEEGGERSCGQTGDGHHWLLWAHWDQQQTWAQMWQSALSQASPRNICRYIKHLTCETHKKHPKTKQASIG